MKVRKCKQMDDLYIRLETGPLIKGSLLLGSGLYSSMLESTSISTNMLEHRSLREGKEDKEDKEGKRSKENEREKEEKESKQMEEHEVVQLPVPAGISDETMKDYINFVDAEGEGVVNNIKEALKACSLLDDPKYLEFCVKRLLCHYDKCKDVLKDINSCYIEEIYLLMPKDLWPEHLQNCDKMLAKWLHKHYFGILNCNLISHEYNYEHGYKQVECCSTVNIQFPVNSYIYVYTIVTYGHNKTLMGIFCNVLNLEQAQNYIHDIDSVNHKFCKLPFVNVTNIDIRKQLLTSKSPMFTVEDIKWNCKIHARESLVCYNIKDGHKIINYIKSLFGSNGLTYWETITISPDDNDQQSIMEKYGDENQYEIMCDENGIVDHITKINPHVKAVTHYYNGYTDWYNSTLLMFEDRDTYSPVLNVGNSVNGDHSY